jgi:VWFA-related protein
MTRVLSSGLLIVGLTLTAAAQDSGSPMVVLDVVVTDRYGQSVTDLTQADFEIEDEGKAVKVETFSAVSLDGSSPDKARAITVLMDDFGVPASGTNAIKGLSQNLLSKMGPADRIAILRLQDSVDRAATEPAGVMDMINGYIGGARPFVPTETPEDVMRKATALMRRASGDAPRRHALVCIGSPAVCAVAETNSQAPRGLYPAWVEAVTAAGQTNTTMYGVIPATAQVTAATLASRTGGELFITTTAFDAAFERIWSELSHYYLVGYRPLTSSRDLPSISAKVKRRGVTVRARTRRGR